MLPAAAGGPLAQTSQTAQVSIATLEENRARRQTPRPYLGRPVAKEDADSVPTAPTMRIPKLSQRLISASFYRRSTSQRLATIGVLLLLIVLMSLTFLAALWVHGH